MYQTDIDARCKGKCENCEYKDKCEARKISLIAEETIKNFKNRKE